MKLGIKPRETRFKMDMEKTSSSQNQIRLSQLTTFAASVRVFGCVTLAYGWKNILLTFFVTIALGCGRLQAVPKSPSLITPQDQVNTESIVTSDDRIKRLIGDLSNADSKKGEEVQQTLIALARESPEQRKTVIENLLYDAQNRVELDGTHIVLPEETFEYWFRTTNIFATLNAEEAIDFMIRCIYAGNGFTGSLSHQPALEALRRMGKLAVPKLKVALIDNRDALTRAHVAICLGSIGGADARKALEQALYRESDEQVRKHLKTALSTLAVVKKQVR
jgi:hypothetical protein